MSSSDPMDVIIIGGAAGPSSELRLVAPGDEPPISLAEERAWSSPHGRNIATTAGIRPSSEAGLGGATEMRAIR